jgi:2'-5' RNA ligase
VRERKVLWMAPPPKTGAIRVAGSMCRHAVAADHAGADFNEVQMLAEDEDEETPGDWDPGKRAYRFGVILVLPPEPVRSQVNALRARYDPISHAVCDAHISLTVPLPRWPDGPHWKELEAVASVFRPFEIRYGPLANSLPHPGVVLSVEPQDKLDKLRALIEASAVFQGAAPRPYPLWAHMTIAEFITIDRTLELMTELRDAPSGSFHCDRLHYLAPDSHFRFVERGTLLLHG